MYWARAKVGKNKWVWIRWSGSCCWYYATDLQFGYSTEEPHLDGEQESANQAKYWHEEQVKLRKVQRPAKGSKAQPVEYLWYSSFDEEVCKRKWIAVPILRKTEKRVYLRHYDRSLSLDRRKLELNGNIWSKRGWQIFYLQPGQDDVVPEYLQVLGLGLNATEEQVKTAYRRLARRHHPDVGGDAEEFKRVHAAYEMALSRS